MNIIKLNSMDFYLNPKIKNNNKIIYHLYHMSIDDINIDKNSKINIDLKNIYYHNTREILKSLNILNLAEIDYMWYLIYFKYHYYSNYTYEEVYKIIKKDPKVEYRYFCVRYLNNLKQKILPKIKLGLKNEAVLIEGREFINIEFVLRNAILKLGETWSFTIVCCNGNYNFVKKMVSEINRDIKIIKSNINEYMKYDYIGAPWPKNQDDNKFCVGNGGLSLRTKETMLKVINKISINETTYNKSTKKYMINCKLNTPPEDVYFSKNIIDFNLGIVADYNTAKRFSIESVYYKKPFGGHNFWLSNNNWKDLLYTNCLKIYEYNQIYKSEHRGGWNTIVTNLYKNDIIKNPVYIPFKNPIIFDDLLEDGFLWNKEINKKWMRPWVGIIHCLPNIKKKFPFMKDILCINNMFKNNNFLKSLKYCKYIIVLSKYLKFELEKILKLYNINVKVKMLYHPLINDDVKKFKLNKFIKNKNIVQLGQQYRALSFIYQLKTNIPKVWLPGTKNIKRMYEGFKLEMNYYKNKLYGNVDIKYFDNYVDYDNYMLNNHIILPLLDASANNAVIECIIRNIPVHITKLPAVVEYLGKDYPLYFNTNEELLKNIKNKNKIMKAFNYLKIMDKDFLDIKYFVDGI